jgi:hypothetical protein
VIKLILRLFNAIISQQHAKSSHEMKKIAANCGVSMEKKNDNHVHGQSGGIRNVK